MSTNTPFHQDNTTPPPPPPFKPEPVKRTPVPVWAWGLGALLLAAIIALVIVLGNGDSEPEAVPAPAVTVTETAKPEPAPKPSVTLSPEAKKTIEATPPSSDSTEQTRKPVAMSEAEFLGFLREQFPILKTVSDEEIMDYSADTCNALDDGATPEDTMMNAVVNSSSGEQAEALGGIVGASVSNYCPEYYNDFAKFLDEQGVVVES